MKKRDLKYHNIKKCYFDFETIAPEQFEKIRGKRRII